MQGNKSISMATGKIVAMLAGCFLLPFVAVGAEDILDSAEARARALCVHMTLEEKGGELMVFDYRDFVWNRWNIYTHMVCRRSCAHAQVFDGPFRRRLPSCDDISPTRDIA